MYTYYGVLKDGIYFLQIKKKLKDAGLKMLDFQIMVSGNQLTI